MEQILYDNINISFGNTVIILTAHKYLQNNLGKRRVSQTVAMQIHFWKKNLVKNVTLKSHICYNYTYKCSFCPTKIIYGCIRSNSLVNYEVWIVSDCRQCLALKKLNPFTTLVVISIKWKCQWDITEWLHWPEKLY